MGGGGAANIWRSSKPGNGAATGGGSNQWGGTAHMGRHRKQGNGGPPNLVRRSKQGAERQTWGRTITHGRISNHEGGAATIGEGRSSNQGAGQHTGGGPTDRGGAATKMEGATIGDGEANSGVEQQSCWWAGKQGAGQQV